MGTKLSTRIERLELEAVRSVPEPAAEAEIAAAWWMMLLEQRAEWTSRLERYYLSEQAEREHRAMIARCDAYTGDPSCVAGNRRHAVDSLKTAAIWRALCDLMDAEAAADERGIALASQALDDAHQMPGDASMHGTPVYSRGDPHRNDPAYRRWLELVEASDQTTTKES